MGRSPLDPHQATASELQERLAARRRGDPFVVYRDRDGAQRIVGLGPGLSRLTLGRNHDCDVCLDWDSKVSRLHAELERVGGEWLVVDDGVSSNGTFIREHRVSGRRRLADGDVLRLGSTLVAFCRPGPAADTLTEASEAGAAAAHVTEAQRRVLVALCRPFKDDADAATPATNPQIAAELHLTVAAVKTHLRAVFHVFGIDHLPQQEKRRMLVALAFRSGLVADRDL